MSSQADWNHLVVDLRNNIFRLFSFAFDCSKEPADAKVYSAEKSDVSSSDYDDVPCRKKHGRKNVKSLPSPSNRWLRSSSRLASSAPCKPRSSCRSGAKRKKWSAVSSSPSPTLPPMEEAASAAVAAVTVSANEDVTFQDVF
jgi:hypothetical protein